MTELAVIRVRGDVHVSKELKATFTMLRLHKVNHCVLLPNTPNYVGMLKKVKDYVTWGVVSKDVIEKLLAKRGRVTGNKRLTDDFLKENSEFTSIKALAGALFDGKVQLKTVKDVKPVLRLNPPHKGYERKGIKISFKQGGVLGDRAEKIDLLLKKMV